MNGSIDYSRVCFIIMPFGKKMAGSDEVDFDRIYDEIFFPAVCAARLPEGGTLEPRRTDRDFFTGDIGHEMFQYIEYSRVALADITGLSANVFYELGARHRAREAGTVILRQVNAPIPFDINKIKAFPYEYDPEDRAEEARQTITRVLTESLRHNRLDSPVQLALKVQRERSHFDDLDSLLEEAENALRNQDPATATLKYQRALEDSPDNPLLRLKVSLLLKDQGRWSEALSHLAVAVSVAPSYAEAHREKGIAENKIWWGMANPPADMPDGEASLRRAIELNPGDFDALSSLAGILKRKEKWKEASELYEQATRVSHGHPYPMLNALKLAARASGLMPLDDKARFRLERAEYSLRAQVANNPPYNAPWSFFDLAEIRLYLGDAQEFTKFLNDGVRRCTGDWQPRTFRESLQLLIDGGIDLPGLADGVVELREAERRLEAP
jgi:tetratricopeptide (TPR) repeat protein